MREPLSTLDTAGNGAVRVTVSVGMASFPEDGSDTDSLLHAADQQIYERKSAQRGAG